MIPTRYVSSVILVLSLAVSYLLSPAFMVAISTPGSELGLQNALIIGTAVPFILGVLGGLGGLLISFGYMLNNEGQAVPKPTWLGRSLRWVRPDADTPSRDPLRTCAGSTLVGIVLISLVFGAFLAIVSVPAILFLLSSPFFGGSWWTALFGIAVLMYLYIVFFTNLKIPDKYDRAITIAMMSVMFGAVTLGVIYGIHRNGLPEWRSFAIPVTILGVYFATGFIYVCGMALMKRIGVLETLCPVIAPSEKVAQG